MKMYVVDAPGKPNAAGAPAAGVLKLFTGTVQLTRQQAEGRLRSLKPVTPEPAPGGGFTGYSSDGCYEVVGEIHFKAGEELGYDGMIPPGAGASLKTPD